MATRLKNTTYVLYLLLILNIMLCGSAEKQILVKTRGKVGLEVKCGEAGVRITVNRAFVEERRVPFKPEYLHLGPNPTQHGACRPASRGSGSGSDMVIYAGLGACGAKSSIIGEWLIYSNQLFLCPAVIPISRGSVIVKGATTVIPVECHYKRERRVNGEPLSPTWLPMTSTISAVGLLHFSLNTMTEGWTAPRSSSVYQRGEAVFLEARVEDQQHPPLRIYIDYCVATLRPDPLSLPNYKFIINNGCLVDSIFPGSPSKFLHREQANRLSFSVQTFHFTQATWEQMFITCHLRATLIQIPLSHSNKACFFHSPTFSWRAAEGDSNLCQCCDSGNCLAQAAEESGGHTVQPQTEKEHEADITVGPVHTLPVSHWTGRHSLKSYSTLP
ncbi:zona pellucida sperm-binding protein 3-like [Genypterus blacodes]|uniref:zona pellucida sperm-binding protein 3-like n=1 Tax=Genypterus blacodes TaxID=154954 RepID=UPI003F770625